MPAKSKSQQRFFGMVDAYRKGELKDASQSIKDAAESMSMKDIKKFAKTKHKGLPNHVKHKKTVKEGMSHRAIFDRAIYIVSDGTSAYEIYGCDYNEAEEEILKGPFQDTPENRERIETLVEKYNDEINGTEMLREGSERQALLKVQRAIYSMVNKNFGGVVRDDAWQNVKQLRDAIQNVPGVEDVEMWAGEYHNYLHSANNNASPYRDYKTIVHTQFGDLSGYIRCCAAGTVDDPFSAYDMVISLYPTQKESMGLNENIMTNSNENIKSALEQIKQLSEPYFPTEKDEYGFDTNVISDIINNYFIDFDGWTNYDEEPQIKVTNRGLYALGYALANYDLICLNEDGTVNTEQSNHQDIAQIASQIIPQNILAKIAESLNIFGGTLKESKKQRKIRLGENRLKQIVAESIKKILNETKGLKSKKLYDIFSKYGYPHYGHRNFSSFDLHNVEDKDVVGVFPYREIPKTMGEEINWVKLMGYNFGIEDGLRNVELSTTSQNGDILVAVIIVPNLNYDTTSVEKEGGFKDYVQKKRDRATNVRKDGAKEYQWKDGGEAKSMIFNNPYFKDWSPESKQREFDKIKSLYR